MTPTRRDVLVALFAALVAAGSALGLYPEPVVVPCPVVDVAPPVAPVVVDVPPVVVE